jgi:hypothetical protein
MGHVTGFIGTFTDVTALRNLEKARVELERTRREEAEARYGLPATAPSSHLLPVGIGPSRLSTYLLVSCCLACRILSDAYP